MQGLDASLQVGGAGQQLSADQVTDGHGTALMITLGPVAIPAAIIEGGPVAITAWKALPQAARNRIMAGAMELIIKSRNPMRDFKPELLRRDPPAIIRPYKP